MQFLYICHLYIFDQLLERDNMVLTVFINLDFTTNVVSYHVADVAFVISKIMSSFFSVNKTNALVMFLLSLIWREGEQCNISASSTFSLPVLVSNLLLSCFSVVFFLFFRNRAHTFWQLAAHACTLPRNKTHEVNPTHPSPIKTHFSLRSRSTSMKRVCLGQGAYFSFSLPTVPGTVIEW